MWWRGWRAGRWSALALLLALVALPPATSNARAPAEPHAVRALFFGDSLMNGTGARPVRPVMARVAARALGWDVTIDGFGGTGFTTGGKNGKPYLDRLRAPGVLTPSYDVVLLAGGTNDRAADAATVHRRATEVIAFVQTRLPDAQLVLMGAFNPGGRRYDARRVQVDAALRAVAREQGVPFISPMSQGWSTGRGARFLSRDGLHPSAYGYGVMGARLATALAAARVGFEK